MNNNTYEGFDSSHFIAFLYQWKRTFLIVGVAALIISSVFSSKYFITPLYKSQVVLFPTSTNAISKALISTTYGGKEDILEFGEDEQVEQMLQILNSNKIRDSIISKYQLSSHYKISETDELQYTKLYKRYESNIRFKRTENSAVKIIVYDRDAKTAANIANDISVLYDYVKNNMKRQRAYVGFKIVEREYLKLKAEIAVKEDSLTALRKLGVHDYESQSEMINRQMGMEIAKGNDVGIERLQKQLNILALYGGPYVSIRDALEHDKKLLSEIKAKYEEAKVDAEQDLPQKFVVNTAYEAEKKAYPIRWLIVLISVIGALFVSVLIIITFEQVDKLQLKKKV